jgi:hypothetical protein
MFSSIKNNFRIFFFSNEIARDSHIIELNCMHARKSSAENVLKNVCMEKVF